MQPSWWLSNSSSPQMPPSYHLHCHSSHCRRCSAPPWCGLHSEQCPAASLHRPGPPCQQKKEKAAIWETVSAPKRGQEGEVNCCEFVCTHRKCWNHSAFPRSSNSTSTSQVRHSPLEDRQYACTLFPPGTETQGIDRAENSRTKNKSSHQKEDDVPSCKIPTSSFSYECKSNAL